MDRGYTQQRVDWTNQIDYDAPYMNSLVKILDSQVHGALEGVGGGVIEGGVVAAGTGLSVTVTALKGIADTQHGLTYLQTDATEIVSDLDADSTVYIHAGAVFSADPDETDSRESAVLLLFASDSDTETDAILLATVTTGAAAVLDVTDSRTMVPVQQALAAIAAIDSDITDLETDVEGMKDVLGDGYYDANGDPVGGEDSVHDRLTDLEGGGGGGGSVVYWGGLDRSSGDATTIPEYVAEQVGSGSGGGDSTGGTVVQLPSDIEISNHLRLALRLMHALPEVEETQRYSYYFIPGISAAALYDAGLTTATVNTTNHTIG